MSQSHGSTLWQEPANSGATPTLTLGRFVLVSAGIYELRDVGVAAASFVSDGVGGYDLSDTNLAGTGVIVVVNGATGVLY